MYKIFYFLCLFSIFLPTFASFNIIEDPDSIEDGDLEPYVGGENSRPAKICINGNCNFGQKPTGETACARNCLNRGGTDGLCLPSRITFQYYNTKVNPQICGSRTRCVCKGLDDDFIWVNFF